MYAKTEAKTSMYKGSKGTSKLGAGQCHGDQCGWQVREKGQDEGVMQSPVKEGFVSPQKECGQFEFLKILLCQKYIK